jgi:hypothetical protein
MMKNISSAGLAYLEHSGALQEAQKDAHEYLGKLWERVKQENIAPFSSSGAPVIWKKARLWDPKTLSSSAGVSIGSNWNSKSKLSELKRAPGIVLRDYRDPYGWECGGREVVVLLSMGNATTSKELRRAIDEGHWNEVISRSRSRNWNEVLNYATILRCTVTLSGNLDDDVAALQEEITAARTVFCDLLSDPSL